MTPLKSPPQNGEMCLEHEEEPVLLGQKLAVSANQAASKICFRHLAKTQNYKESYSYINRFSYFLQNEIQHNKKVMIYMTNCPHIAYAFFACVNTKNTVVLMDPSAPEPQVVDTIKDLGIEVVIASDDLLSRFKELMKNNRLSLQLINCESRRWGEYDETYRLPTSITAADNDVVAYFQTSGTTGKPKWVPYTHTMIQQSALILRSIYRINNMDTFMTYGASLAHPFYFMHGLVLPLMSGASVEICDFATTFEELAKELLEAKVTRMIMRSNYIYDWLMSFKNMNLKLPLLRSITPEYGNIAAATYELALQEFNTKILNIYGSVESCWAVAGRQFEEPEPQQTVGRFLSGIKTRIVDDNGDDIPPNKQQLGQLIVSGPTLASTYFNNKEATKVNMRGQWFFTGDIVEVDKSGVVSFVDRRDNMLTVVGQWVIPKTIEEEIAKIPAVAQVAVIHTKDAQGKSIVTAVVAKKAGTELTGQDVQKQCENLPEKNRPQAIAFMAELPVNSRGIIDKYKLRREFN